MADSAPPGMVDRGLFEHLQDKIDEDAAVREELQTVLHKLDRQGRTSLSILSKAHSIPIAQLRPTVAEAGRAIGREIGTISELSAIASRHPYYKYNNLWTRAVQNVTFALLLNNWLGGGDSGGSHGYQSQPGQLLTIEEVGKILQVPVNLKDRDAFHLTIEEYLQALINLIEELARLAVNSVTLGDYNRPLEISKFVKDLHAGFQILNLKNDSLRRRSDSIKYNVKKVEDVVYDLSLRNLIPKT